MKNLLYLLFLFSTQFAFSQSELPEGFGDYRTIENAEAGKIYYQMYVPPVFEINVWKDSVLRVEDNQHLLENLTLGIDYKINTTIVKISPMITTWTYEMPTIDTIIEQRKHIFYSNCEYVNTPNPNWKIGDRIIEKVLVKPETIVFYPVQDKMIHCCNHSGVDIFVAWLAIGKPEKYAHKRKIIRQSKKGIWLETIADTIRFDVVKYQFKPYKKVKKTKVEEFDTIQSIELLNVLTLENPIYSTILQRQIVEQGDFSTKWTESLCTPHPHTKPYIILEIQKALNAKGYPVDLTNIFDKETKTALIQFQKANGLHIHQLGNEVLKVLGVQ